MNALVNFFIIVSIFLDLLITILNYYYYYSLGPSGPNSEYLLNLASALRTIAPNVYDAHLFDLEERILKLIKTSSYL